MTVVNWSGVELFASPWAIPGVHEEVSFGSVQSELRLDGAEGYEKAEREVLDSLRGKAASLGANAIVGFALNVDPFAGTGFYLRVSGMAVRLVDT